MCVFRNVCIMYVWVYVCIFVCECMYVSMKFKHSHIHMHMFVCMWEYWRKNGCVYLESFVLWIYACMWMCICLYVNMYVCLYVCFYVCLYVRKYDIQTQIYMYDSECVKYMWMYVCYLYACIYLYSYIADTTPIHNWLTRHKYFCLYFSVEIPHIPSELEKLREANILRNEKFLSKLLTNQQVKEENVVKEDEDTSSNEGKLSRLQRIYPTIYTYILIF